MTKYKNQKAKLDTKVLEPSIAKSIAESFISIYNIHNSKLRPIEEDTVEDEMMIHLNGPEIGEADNVLKSALDSHLKGQPWRLIVKESIYKSPGKTCQEKVVCHSVNKYCKKKSVMYVERI